MYRPGWALSAMVAIATFFTISACSEAAGPDRLTPTERDAATYGHTLIQCPVNDQKSASATLGARGGTIRLDRHELNLPLAAVAEPTPFTLAAPVSNYMEVRIRANEEDHFEFDRPVTIVIDYSRCTRSNIEKAALTVWKIDPVAKTLLQNMGGIDNKEDRTIEFQSETLSTWSIAR